MGRPVAVDLTVDGTAVHAEVEPRLLLVHLLRTVKGPDAVAVGCDTSNCGACLVAIDGEIVKSCNVLAVQTRGCSVVTVRHPELIGPAFERTAAALPVDALPCESCRSGAVLGVGEWIDRGATGGEPGLRRHLEGLLCRCGAYDRMVAAARDAVGAAEPGAGEVGA